MLFKLSLVVFTRLSERVMNCFWSLADLLPAYRLTTKVIEKIPTADKNDHPRKLNRIIVQKSSMNGRVVT